MIGVKRLKGGTKFVVLSSQRSGSTWLVSLLNQVEGARAYGELFLKRKKAGVEDYWDEDLIYPHFPEAYARSKQIRPRAVFSYLGALFCQPEAVGLKLMYTQLQKYPEIMLYLFIHRIRVIHLVRQNQVDVLISRAIKNKIKRAHVVSGDSLPKDIQVEINPQKFLKRLERRQKRIEAARRLLRWSTLPSLEVTYEDLLIDPTSFGQLCHFLHIEMKDQIPESRLVKIGGKRQAEVVSNFAEIREALAGTPYVRWIDSQPESNLYFMGLEERVETK